MTKGLSGRIRGCISAFSSRRTFSAPAVARMIGESDARAVENILADFLARGEIIKKAPGRYSYKGVSKFRKKPSPVTLRIYRAMHVSRTFSAQDIVILSDATMRFVLVLIQELMESGDIVTAGKRKNINCRWEVIRRVKDQDAFYLKHLIELNNKRRGKGT